MVAQIYEINIEVHLGRTYAGWGAARTFGLSLKLERASKFGCC